VTGDGRERELKYSIPRLEDWRAIRDAPDWGERGSPELQRNFYFDTEGRDLVRNGSLLRIRLTGADYVLTLKHGRETSPGYFDSAELEAPVAPEALEAAIALPASLLDLDIEPVRELVRLHGRPALVYLGTLENERVRRRVEAGGAGDLVLEVDRMRFPDGSEAHELEIEVGAGQADAAAEWILDRARRRGIRLDPERATKLERFLAWLDRSGEPPPPGPHP